MNGEQKYQDPSQIIKEFVRYRYGGEIKENTPIYPFKGNKTCYFVVRGNTLELITPYHTFIVNEKNTEEIKSILETEVKKIKETAEQISDLQTLVDWLNENKKLKNKE